MRKILLLFAFLFLQNAFAQNLILTFDGVTGDPSVNAPLDKVIIENLTKNESIELTGSFVINFSLLGLNDFIQEPFKIGIQKVHPNPTNSSAFIDFYSEGVGETTINFYNILGQSVANFSEELNKGLHKLEFTPQDAGIYLIDLFDNGHKDFSKLIASKNNANQATLLYVNKNTSKKESQTNTKKETNTFTFDIGDELKYTGFYGSLTDVIYDSPTESKTVTFDFQPNLNRGDTAEEVLITHNDALALLNEFLSDTNINEAVGSVMEWLNTSPDINSVSASNGNIEISYSSGITSVILVSQVNEDGSRTKGGLLDVVEIANEDKINENKNTGVSGQFNTTALLCENNTITNRDVLVIEAFGDQFQLNEGGEIADLFLTSDLGFNVTYLKYPDDDITVETMRSLSNYGFVYFDTHCSGGKYIMTREKVDVFNALNAEIYSNQLAIMSVVYYVQDEPAALFGDFYAITDKFIDNLLVPFPENTIIYNSACQGAQSNQLLADAFTNKGAAAYLGYEQSVTNYFSKSVGIEYVGFLLNDKKSVVEAYSSLTETIDPNADPTKNGNLLYFANCDVTFQEESLSTDAKNIRLILGNAGLDVSNPLWDSTNDADLTTILQQNGCYVQNGRVYYINWNNKSLGSISAEIGNLTALEHLLLINNNLNSLPQEIGSLNNLLELTVNNNNLTSINASIANLQKLTDLFWTQNGLTTVPAFIGDMNTLDNVHFENNSLTSVSPNLGNLTNLNFLVFYTNPTLKCLPQEVWNIGSAVRTDLSTGDTDCSQ